MFALQVGLLFVLYYSAAAQSATQPAYVDYRLGTLNLVITVPHGGLEMPDSIANRTAGCLVGGSCVYRHNCTPDYVNCKVTVEHDSYLYKAAEKIGDHLRLVTGKSPTLILNRLNRVKLDPNRPIEEATFGEQIAVDNYKYYHEMVEVTKAEIQATAQFNSFLVIDLHGQSHAHNLTELGYNLSAAQLDADSYSLQSSGTLRYAAKALNYSKSIITGQNSLGFLLERHKIPCLPSPTNLKVNGRDYYDGGYTSVTHSSDDSDTLQLEISRTVRFTADEEQFNENMKRIARGIANFLDMHYSEKQKPNNNANMAMLSNSLMLILFTLLILKVE